MSVSLFVPIVMSRALAHHGIGNTHDMSELILPIQWRAGAVQRTGFRDFVKHRK